jgi:hypothetical protein
VTVAAMADVVDGVVRAVAAMTAAVVGGDGGLGGVGRAALMGAERFGERLRCRGTGERGQQAGGGEQSSEGESLHSFSFSKRCR